MMVMKIMTSILIDDDVSHHLVLRCSGDGEGALVMMNTNALQWWKSSENGVTRTGRISCSSASTCLTVKVSGV